MEKTALERIIRGEASTYLARGVDPNKQYQMALLESGTNYAIYYAQNGAAHYHLYVQLEKTPEDWHYEQIVDLSEMLKEDDGIVPRVNKVKKDGNEYRMKTKKCADGTDLHALRDLKFKPNDYIHINASGSLGDFEKAEEVIRLFHDFIEVSLHNKKFISGAQKINK